MSAAAPALVVEPAQRSVLESIAKASTAPYREVLRAWFAAQGLRTFAEVVPGRGRKPSIPQETVDRVVRAIVHDKPAGHTHWSCRAMAEAMGTSKDTVARCASDDGRGMIPRRPNA